MIIFGRFPYEEQWRPAVGTAVIVLMLVLTAVPKFWSRRGVRVLGAAWVAAFAVFFSLMYGGVFGLSPVDPDSWGGLPLTVILTLIGMTLSSPLGILARDRAPLEAAACKDTFHGLYRTRPRRAADHGAFRGGLHFPDPSADGI